MTDTPPSPPPGPPDDIDPLVLERYLAGEASSDDNAIIACWVAIAPVARHAWLDAFRRTRQRQADAIAQWDVAPLWARLSARMEPRATVPSTPTRRSPVRVVARTRGAWWPSMMAAAAVLAAVGLVTRRDVWRPLPHSSLGAREMATRNGQRASLTLGDGTRVVLGVGSTLRTATPSDGRETRDVYLEGEAYFDVRHDAAHPFVVHTARGAAEDLGTRFDVRAYAQDRALRVVVRDGSVAITRPCVATKPCAPAASMPALQAGDLAVLDTAGREAITHGVAVDDFVGWTEGKLAFHETPLRQALAELARWYDIDVTLTDGSVGDRPVSGSFADAAASRVLDAIGASAGVRWVQVGRVVVVSPVKSGSREGRDAP